MIVKPPPAFVIVSGGTFILNLLLLLVVHRVESINSATDQIKPWGCTHGETTSCKTAAPNPGSFFISNLDIDIELESSQNYVFFYVKLWTILPNKLDLNSQFLILFKPIRLIQIQPNFGSGSLSMFDPARCTSSVIATLRIQEEKIGLRSFGCFLKWWYPQIIRFNWVFHYKPSILGYHHFWKHPF